MDNSSKGRDKNSSRPPIEYLLTGIVKRPLLGYKFSKHKVRHGAKILKRLKSQLSYADQKLYSARQFQEGSNKQEEFFCYNANDEADPDESVEIDDDDNLSSNSSDEQHNNSSSSSSTNNNYNSSNNNNNSSCSSRGINVIANINNSHGCGGKKQMFPNGKGSGNAKSVMFQDVSVNIADYVTQRHLGNLSVRQPAILQSHIMESSFNSQPDFSIKHLLVNGILQEKAIKVENLNKVFCSQWLSDKQTILGTKCNKLIVLDVQTKHMTQIPSLTPSARSLPPDSQCGIHAIEINPSRTLLATGGKNPNDVAVYKLPTMDPVCVGEIAHQDWVFGLAWINDEYFVSGSRDTSLAMWRVPDDSVSSSDMHDSSSISNFSDSSGDIFNYSSDSSQKSLYNNCYINNNSIHKSASLDHSYIRIPAHTYMTAVSRKECKSAQKVRDVVFNRKFNEVACVSLNGYLHIWTTENFMQKFSKKLPFSLENVCLAVHEDYGLYAVGSKSHTTLLDSRTIQPVKKIPSKYSGYGIRSANFYSTLLSIGTGHGTIMFYDLRAGKYLETYTSTARSATLKSSTGWTYPEEEVIMDVYRQPYTPAIYTHCIDMSGTRIFAAGGPLPITLCGNYIGLWH